MSRDELCVTFWIARYLRTFQNVPDWSCTYCCSCKWIFLSCFEDLWTCLCAASVLIVSLFISLFSRLWAIFVLGLAWISSFSPSGPLLVVLSNFSSPQTLPRLKNSKISSFSPSLPLLKVQLETTKKLIHIVASYKNKILCLRVLNKGNKILN